MKKLFFVALGGLLVCASCGNSKAEEEARRQAEQARADSIAAVARADSIERARQDSIELAVMKSRSAERHAQDSVVIARLEPKFRTTDKALLNSDGVVYTPKTAPSSKKVDALYLTFRRYADRAAEPTLYYQIGVHDDADEIESITVIIDGADYMITVTDHTQDLNDASRWREYGSGTVPSDMLNALVNAQSVKVHYKSPNNELDKTVTGVQLQALKDAAELYRACGG